MWDARKKIPKNLKECYETDSVSANLWGWSLWVEKWGRIILFVILAIGTFSTIGVTIEAVEIDSDAWFLVLLSSALTWALYAFLEYCAYHIISLLIASLASIVQNTRVSANVALYNTAKVDGFPDEETAPSAPVAAKVHEKRSSVLTNLAQEKAYDENSWRCKECGTPNPADKTICKNCGKYR